MAVTTSTAQTQPPPRSTANIRATAVARELGRWVLRLVLFGLLLGVWEFIVVNDWVREIIVPRPTDIFANFFQTITSSDIFPHMSVTMQETLAGFAIGSSVGLGLALIVILAPGMTFVLQDYITAFQSIPKVVFIPILITWFGFGMESKIYLAAMISFFPVYITSVVGMNGTPTPALRLMVLMRANRIQRLYKLQFLHALPTIFAGLKNAFTNSLIGAIVAEFFGATEGLGYLIVVHNHALRIPEVFSLIIILSLLAVIGYTILDWAGKRICFWMPSS
ncbi:MAG: ABC transporter permease subunit [Dehalococcoidia bacterium]|nr:ABC transporter permease subunit [Dehalococcoidia bacterium]